MKLYKITRHARTKSPDRNPGKGNPLPTRTAPTPEEPGPGPETLPKRKKKSIYEIVMN